jgi:hypothetical protein
MGYRYLCLLNMYGTTSLMLLLLHLMLELRWLSHRLLLLGWKLAALRHHLQWQSMVLLLLRLHHTTMQLLPMYRCHPMLVLNLLLLPCGLLLLHMMLLLLLGGLCQLRLVSGLLLRPDDSTCWWLNCRRGDGVGSAAVDIAFSITRERHMRPKLKQLKKCRRHTVPDQPWF